MTPERRADIRDRVEAVERDGTAGEWAYLEGTDTVEVYPSDAATELVATVWGEAGSEEETALGRFIAAARRDVPDLLAEVERLRTEQTRLLAEVEDERRRRAAYVKGMRAGYDAEIDRLKRNGAVLIEQLGKVEAERDQARAALAEALDRRARDNVIAGRREAAALLDGRALLHFQVANALGCGVRFDRARIERAVAAHPAVRQALAELETSEVAA
ncbi:hypothetical protein OHR68_09795 [Spirillospora sp. NBC_00431]